jgi:enterochelin esterase-like enzyme
MPRPFPNLPLEHRGQVTCLSLRSTVLADNPWGDPATRDLHVYTPPGYGEGDARYPVIMLLAGFSGTGEAMLGRSLTEVSIAARIDRLIAEVDCPPFICVLPDGMSSLGGTQFVDSLGIGAYATHLIDELRPFVEANFRTNGRWGSAGKSSGGFGSLHLAMSHPGALQAVASHAGDMGFSLAYLGDLPGAVAPVRQAGGPRAFVDAFWAMAKPSGRAFGAMNLLCMAAAYTTDATPTADGFPARLPVDFGTGEVDFDVLHSWNRFDPIERAKDEAALAALAGLDLLWIDAGDRDEYNLQLGAQRFCTALTSAGVAHRHEEFQGTHRGLSWRFDHSLPAMARVLIGG